LLGIKINFRVSATRNEALVTKLLLF